MANKIDLHIHTIFSDGAYTPKEVIDMAFENGVDTIAISDHDTIDAYTDTLFEYAKSKGINLISGVEISTKYNGFGIHVLGYNIDLKNQKLQDCLNMLKNARKDYLKNVSVVLNKLGYKLNVDKLSECPSVTKAHIAIDVVTNIENKELLLKTFGHIPQKGEFIEAIMNEGCVGYVEKYTITPVQASKIIKEANGKVVLAHPVAYMWVDGVSYNELDSLIKEMQADGVEANYLYVDKYDNLVNESECWCKYCEENNLLSTIGSDFHNIDGIRPTIGFKNYDFHGRNVDVKKLLSK